MVRNKLAAAILSASLALPGVASALGVGDYTLKSYLNQPLNLEIGLIQTRDLTTDEVLVNLASAQEFERLGIDRVFFLQGIEFSVVQRPDGGMYVVASTEKAVTEPFLNFLVEVQWPAGRALREYTILLDPPVYKAGDAPTATEQPVSDAAAPETAAPVYAAEPSATVAEAAALPPPLVMSDGSVLDDSGLPPPPSAAAGVTAEPDTIAYQPAAEPVPSRPAAQEGEYRVQANDTMWEIAAQNRGTGTVQQTMLAIQRANPDAFIKGNLNLVKKGAVLRIPGEDEVQQVSRAEASSEFAAQTRAWREMLDQRAAALPSDKAMLEASKPVIAKAAEPKGTGKGEVTLVAPTGSGKAGKASGGKGSEALQNDLAIAKEGIDKATRENKELSSQLTDLDKQVKASDKVLAVKSGKISSLQTELDRLRKEKGVTAPAEPDVDAEPAAAPAEAAPEVEQVPEEVPVEEAVAEPAGSGSMLAPILGLLALLGIGGGAFLFLRNRKKAAPAQVATAAHDEQVEDDLAQLQDLNLGDDEESSIAGAAPEGGDGGGDPVGEADMYVAYGRFQQAADILYAALQREPEREDIRVKLAEVYAEMGDNDSAAEQANKLRNSGNGDIRRQAQAVLARGGGGGLAAGGTSKAPAIEESLSLDDLAQEFSGGGDSTASMPALGDFSLDIDEPAPVAAASAASDDLEFSLDDVELGEEPAFAEAAPASSSNTSVRPKSDFGELSLEDTGFDDLSLPDEPIAEAAAEEFTLEDDLVLEEPAALPVVDEEPDFAATTGAQRKLTDAMVEEVSAAPAPAEVDLESELADLESDLKGEDLGGGSGSGGDDFDFLADSDENATKLDLAKAYIDMGDAEGARDILNEVLAEGSAPQKSEAQKLLAQVG